jgi:hypothetical protein
MVSQYTLVFATTSRHGEGSTVNWNRKNCSSVGQAVKIPARILQALDVTGHKETGDDSGQTWLYAGARLWVTNVELSVRTPNL